MYIDQKKMAADMKLYPVEYLGFTAMDKRFTRPMLPWIIAEIKRRGTSEKVGIQVIQLVKEFVIGKLSVLFDKLMFRLRISSCSFSV